MSIHLPFDTYCIMSHLNMTTQLKQWFRNEVCSVLQFLNARSVSAAEVNCQFMEVYGGVMS
jgi:hypothetical protein